MRANDASYFRARALQEQAAAQRAISEPARVRHDQLATMYRFKASMVEGGPAWISDHLPELSPEAESLDEATAN